MFCNLLRISDLSIFPTAGLRMPYHYILGGGKPSAAGIAGHKGAVFMNSHISECDLDRAFTCLEAAHALHNEWNRRASVEKARAALRDVRCSEGRIQDPAIWLGIHNRADELERAINSLSL